jgi:hypothetical protein
MLFWFCPSGPVQSVQSRVNRRPMFAEKPPWLESDPFDASRLRMTTWGATQDDEFGGRLRSDS